MVGVNWNVTYISGKFLGPSGGYTSDAIKAVDYFTDLKTRHGLNLVATSNSWGGGGYSQGLFDAIERANAQGILFVAAAGNGDSDRVGDNTDTSPTTRRATRTRTSSPSRRSTAAGAWRRSQTTARRASTSALPG